MTNDTPVIVHHVELETDVRAEALYAVLSDVSTHLIWAGEQAPAKDFRLLTLDATPGAATMGTTWSSTGANVMSMTSHDASVVVEAEPGSRFGFDTNARFERRHAKAWLARFEHRYTIERTAVGSRIVYECAVFPTNYTPWWLRAAMRPGVKAMVRRSHRKHMRNLAALAGDARVASGNAAR